MANWILSTKQFFLGLVKDLIPEKVPAEKYIDAENIQLTKNQDQTLGGATPPLGNSYVFDKKNIDFDTDADDYKGWRLELKIDFSGIPHHIIFGSLDFTVTSALSTNDDRYNDLVSQINAATTSVSGDVYIPSPNVILGDGTVHIGFKAYGENFELTETIDATPVDIFVIKEFYGIAGNGVVQPLKSLEIGNNQFQICSNGDVVMLNVGVRNDISGIWTYTTLLRTNQIKFTYDAVIDLVGQIDFSSRVSLYFGGKGYTPRSFYVTLIDPWQTDYAMIWNENPVYIETGNQNGHYTYEDIESNTRIQILENNARVYNTEVLDNSGRLTTGSNIYIVRQVIGVTNYSGFGISCNPTPIFSDSTTDVRLSGNVGGQQSGKAVRLTITGLNPQAYDNFEVIFIQNIDGVFVSYIIGQYPITDITQTITHTGSEAYISISFADLNTQQIIFKDAGSFVIDRNYLFLSNVSIQEDYNISEFAKTITITTERVSLQATGGVYTTVNEYMKPSNVFIYTGYMLNETYRYGIKFFLKSGVTTSVYFISDYKIEYANGSLTDGNYISPPTVIYSYCPSFGIDFGNASAPLIDGIPLIDAIYGYSIERQACIPEVLASGIVMPTTATSVDDFFSVGGIVADLQIGGGYTILDRRHVGFFAMDVLFDQVTIAPIQGDFLLNYGQPSQSQDHLTESRTDGGHVDYCSIVEFGGDVGNYESVEITSGQLAQFNTTRTTQFLGGLRYSTEINAAKFPPASSGTFNQASFGLYVMSDINEITTPFSGEWGFYIAQYIRPQVNKYGPENEGTYQSCSHFRVITDPTILTYIDTVFGGDAFTQKNFTKFCQIKNININDYQRTGVYFYSQNRGNYQLRNFPDNVTFVDYPYTTTSLVDWLSGDTTGSAQEYPGTLDYSTSYTPTNQYQQTASFDPDIPVDFDKENWTYYTGPKIEDSLNDPWRVFLPINAKAYPAIYGAIKNTFARGNEIIIFMDKAILSQQINQQQVITDPNSPALILGDGTVLGARETIISQIGAPIKTGAIQYLSTKGSMHMAYYNPAFKKWFRLGSDGIRDLGVEDQMQSFLTENGKNLGAEWSVVFIYDFYTSELLLCAHTELDGYIMYDLSEPYTIGSLVYSQGAFSTRTYYVALIDVPVGFDPIEIANQLQYWKKVRQSNFVLAFNEKLNAYSSFYSYLPVMGLPYKNTFLSFPSSPGNEPKVYEHNILTNTFYDVDIVSYIEMVFTDYPDMFKKIQSLLIAMKDSPIYLYVKGNNGTLTYGTNFIQQRDYWWTDVYNDATISVDNPTGANDVFTDFVRGEILQVTVFFKGSGNTIKRVDSRIAPQIPYFIQ